jgi:hypothetical protein
MKLFRRRKFILYRRFQFSLLGVSFLHIFIVFFFLSLALFAPIAFELSTGDYRSETFLQASTIFLYIHGRIWWVAILCLVIVGMHSIRTSHRIAGPLYRLDDLYRKVAGGSIPGPLRRSRKGDYLVDQIGLANEMLEAIRTNHQRSMEIQDEVVSGVVKCREMADQKSWEQIADCLDDVAEACRRLKENSSSFRLEA